MSTTQPPLIIGLAGFGTVGGGLVRLLAENGELIRRRAGRDIVIKKILVRDTNAKRAVPTPPGATLTDRPADLAEDPDISVLVELMGGIEAPRALIRDALAHGKHVVTANKALLAEEGGAIFREAAAGGRILRYEAAVAGAVPIVQSLKESLAGNRVLSLMGILNGTSNYILSEMSSNGLDFDSALRQAQELGYAEADPTLDIDGHDAAHKLILLIRLAFGVHYPYADLPVRGIRGISGMDIALAREFGYRIKLVGQVEEHDGDGRLAAGVFPALIHHKLLLARVGGVYNAVRVEGDAAGSLFFHGRGAGALPTAGSVLSDLLAVARDERPNNTGFVETHLPQAVPVPPEECRSRYYVRMMVRDAPGVLRDLAGCMAGEGVSLAQAIQKSDEGRGVPFVFMTHVTTERAMTAALQRAVDMGMPLEPIVSFRIVGGEEQ